MRIRLKKASPNLDLAKYKLDLRKYKLYLAKSKLGEVVYTLLRKALYLYNNIFILLLIQVLYVRTSVAYYTFYLYRCNKLS